MKPVPAPIPPAEDMRPPLTGYIKTTRDALLVFEGCRRGAVPRVTRRLIEREKAMVRSGAIFVFDEHESGIKRWTDGLVWSPSRILGNFLIYRQIDKKTGAHLDLATSAGSSTPSPVVAQAQSITPPKPFAELPGDSPYTGGALRPRSSSETGVIDRSVERQLVGSLTSSYKFKDEGLVKKCISLTIHGYTQHLISYYRLEDVVAGRLRTPSTIPELAGIEISPEYLDPSKFRFPPKVEVGPDGIPRYAGEADNNTESPATGSSQLPYPMASPNDMMTSPNGHVHGRGGLPVNTMSPRSASGSMPMPIPMSPSAVSATSYAAPGSTGSMFYGSMSPMGASHVRPGNAEGGAARPGSSTRNSRFDPYAGASSNRPTSSPRQSQARRPSTGHLSASQPFAYPAHHGSQPASAAYHPPQGQPQYDIKPVQGADGQYYWPPSSYQYYAPTPGSYQPMPGPSGYGAAPPPQQYSGWQPPVSPNDRSNAPRSSLVLPPVNTDAANGSDMGSAPTTTTLPPTDQLTSPASPFQTGPPTHHDWAPVSATAPPGSAHGQAGWDSHGHPLASPAPYQSPLPLAPPAASHQQPGSYGAQQPTPDWRNTTGMSS